MISSFETCEAFQLKVALEVADETVNRKLHVTGTKSGDVDTAISELTNVH